MKVKCLLLVLLCPLLISFHTGSEQVLYGSKSYSTIDSYWAQPPILKICEQSRVSDSRVRMAVEYWKRLGYQFESIIYDDQSTSCTILKPSYGEIIITIPDQNFDFKNIAMTRTVIHSLSKEILHSIIYIQDNKASKERVLEHEFGHAFGWSHSPRSYHIMNKAWENGGYSSVGLELDRYQELIQELILEGLTP